MSGPPPPPPPSGLPPPPPPPGSSSAKAKKTWKVAAGKESLASALQGLDKGKAAGHGANYFAKKSDTGFVGLLNQGATCYMNSLLQSLFLTPEFFDLLFSWSPDASQIESLETSMSIPLQLQRLFVALSLSERRSVPTAALTTAFGWTEADAFAQHDVQELRLVLFEALDRCFSKGGLVTMRDLTGEEVGVRQLFQGTTENYVQCLKCSTRSSRTEPFLDLQLQVKDVSSLAESLDLYLQPDTLMGDNQYSCGLCQTKVDAIRGYSLADLPPILTLQLKRFDYNYATWTRIKLDHAVEFPQTLSMSRWVQMAEGEDSDYELHAVMVHKGGAMGGHYYAFIKALASGQWLRFDDERVTEATEEEVMASSGLTDSATQTALRGTAYMLVYRRTSLGSPSANLGSLPEVLLEEVRAANSAFAKEAAEYEIKRHTLSIQVVLSGQKKHTLRIYQKKTAKEALEQLRAELPDAIGAQPTNQVRLRLHDGRSREAGIPIECEMLERTLEDLKVTSATPLYVEVREAGSEFPVYIPDTSVVVHLIHYTPPPEDAFSDSLPLKFSDEEARTYDSILAAACEALGEAKENLQLLLMDPLTMDVTELLPGNADSLYDGATVYSERKTDAESALAAKKYLIEVLFNQPGERLTSGSLRIDCRKKLRALKEALGRQFGLPIKQFKLCLNAVSKVEFKDLDVTITDAKIFDGGAVFLMEGTALEVGEFRVKLHRYAMREDENADEKPEFRFLAQLVLHHDWKPAELEGHLLEALEEEAGESVAESSEETVMRRELVEETISLLKSVPEGQRIRWREKLGTRAGRLLVRNMTTKESMQSALQDSTELALQLVDIGAGDVEDSLDQLLLQFRRWSPSQWELAPKKTEMAVMRTATVSDVKQMLGEAVDVPAANIKVTKCPLRLRQKEDKMGVAMLKWEHSDHVTITSSPWYLKDGETLLFQDASEPPAVRVEPEMIAAAGGGGVEVAVRIRTQYD